MGDTNGKWYPDEGYVLHKGLCRILYYTGNGFFVLLTKRDERLFVHRDRIRLVNRKH